MFIQQRHRLHDVAMRIVGTRELAEDVLQSSYERIVDVSTRMVSTKRYNYCFQVVRHLAIDCNRRSRFESRFFKASDRCTHGVAATHLSPESAAIALQSLVLVQRALSQLPARTRKAFMLYRVEGLTQRQIATRLRVPLTLVNFMIKDAVDVLKTCRRSIDGAG